MREQQPTNQPEPGARPASPRRGRPPGSVSLTEEIARTIIEYIRAGTFAEVAAELAGISARTFRDWMARGEGRHSTRPATSKLRRFATDVRRAQAEARAAAEIRVHQKNPEHWLRNAARSTAEREGWTTPPPGPDEQSGSEQLARLVMAADARLAARDGKPRRSDGPA